MRRTVHTDRERFRAVAAAAPDGARVPVELRVAVDDPFDAYRRARDGPGGVFYETTGGQSGWGYFGVDPVERLTVAAESVVAGAGDADGAERGEGATRAGDYRRPSASLSALEGVLDGETLARGDCEVPYPCGAFGWLAYDVARELEAFPPVPPAGPGAVDDRGLPRLQAGLFDRIAAWECPVDAEDGDDGEDDETVTLRVTACPRVPAGLDDPEADRDALDALFDEGRARAADLITRIETGDAASGAPPDPTAESATFESDVGREGYADAVRRVKASVRDGDTFQANVSQRLTAPAAVHPVEAYDALREVNPAPYSGLIEFGDRPTGGDLVSASPELLLAREPTDDPDRGARLVTEPIAGTRPRGDTEAADAGLEAELTGDEKERAEHAMLVDLERNDLGKVSRFGTVEVSEYRRVDRYSEVMHLVSLVEGEARPDVGLADAVAACFPGGTITGAPKPRTMEIIDELEPTRRGPYTGSMFAAGFDGRATLNIVIRTLVRHAAEYHLRVGAGIVHDSDPDAEYEETLAKARALVSAVDEALAAGGMAVEADDGPAAEEAAER
ncbi:anthranilate synthase component I family protein [Halorubrum sp. Atlit-8R]|uniref:anthranilate synthase component I family protein n=1 Tax=unclassified Halorubrum TaxID=2642239 RepID=UPI000EF28E57|nr:MULTISPECIES: anthranilate synthase component I family protein [unclassified Halorubrum]RLM71299.1 anthranilate synthase component I family protein [Halorubrum sp. Atlit-9R]RLM72167.1 anthranilate synthase component I family protein [Halorubrum sp. Atlit-9R]RLM82548.1 anthranilate synthase component I family protein [Halorubrum sp. Atlit-8R]